MIFKVQIYYKIPRGCGEFQELDNPISAFRYLKTVLARLMPDESQPSKFADNISKVLIYEKSKRLKGSKGVEIFRTSDVEEAYFFAIKKLAELDESTLKADVDVMIAYLLNQNSKTFLESRQVLIKKFENKKSNQSTSNEKSSENKQFQTIAKPKKIGDVNWTKLFQSRMKNYTNSEITGTADDVDVFNNYLREFLNANADISKRQKDVMFAIKVVEIHFKKGETQVIYTFAKKIESDFFYQAFENKEHFINLLQKCFPECAMYFYQPTK